jgi:hypothetical protein
MASICLYVLSDAVKVNASRRKHIYLSFRGSKYTFKARNIDLASALSASCEKIGRKWQNGDISKTRASR